MSRSASLMGLCEKANEWLEKNAITEVSHNVVLKLPEEYKDADILSIASYLAHRPLSELLTKRFNSANLRGKRQ